MDELESSSAESSGEHRETLETRKKDLASLEIHRNDR